MKRRLTLIYVVIGMVVVGFIYITFYHMHTTLIYETCECVKSHEETSLSLNMMTDPPMWTWDTKTICDSTVCEPLKEPKTQLELMTW